MDAREDGVYITYTPVVGADAVTKKLGRTIKQYSISNSGSINISADFPGFAKLSTANFVAGITSGQASHEPGQGSGKNTYMSAAISGYNASTGVVSYVLRGWGNITDYNISGYLIAFDN